MKTKLDQYIESIKQECEVVLRDYQEAKQLIRDFESRETHLTSIDPSFIFIIDTIKQKIPNPVSKPLLFNNNCFDGSIHEGFIRFISTELITISNQMYNRYARILNAPFESNEDDCLATAFDTNIEFDDNYGIASYSVEEEPYRDNSYSSEDKSDNEDSYSSESQRDEAGSYSNKADETVSYSSNTNSTETGSHDDINELCLRFLFSFFFKGYNRFHKDRLVKHLGYASTDELSLSIIAACRELTSVKATSLTTLSCYFTVPQLLIWGMDQNTGSTFDLTSNEVAFLFDDDKWDAIAHVYKLTQKNTLTLSATTLNAMTLSTIGKAFSNAGISVDKLTLRHFPFSPTDLSELACFLKEIKTNTLDLSYNYFHMQTDAKWWEALCSMLKTGGIKKVNLSNNELFKMSHSLWKHLCLCLSDTKIESVEIDGINSKNLAQMNSSLKKTLAPDSFFHHKKDTGPTNTGGATCNYLPSMS